MADRAPPPRRADYRYFCEIPTRWLDCDLYGHVNNAYYYVYFDVVIARVLIEEGGLDPWHAPVIGYCVESGCKFHKGARFPECLTAGLKVERIGRSSVRYGIALFRNGDDEAAASGFFVHVFVDRASERPAPLPEAVRAALTRYADDTD